MESKSILVSLATVLAIGLLVDCELAPFREADLLIVRMIDTFGRLYAGLDKETQYAVETFGSLVGRHRLYEFTLSLWPHSQTSYKNIKNFLEEFHDDLVLNRTTDSDAATETLSNIVGTELLRRLQNEQETGELVDMALVRYCDNYLQIFGPELFDGYMFKLYVKSENLFDQELAKVGHLDELKRFLLGWANYRICQALTKQSRSSLVHKLFVRRLGYLDWHPQFPKYPIHTLDAATTGVNKQ